MKAVGHWILAGTIALESVVAHATPESKGSYPSCTTTPTEADRKAAQGAFAAGQGSFNEADYPTAILYWRDAYRRDCTAHALLLNLARAYELKGERGEAIYALETYLERKPDDPNVEQIQRRIQNLKAQMAAQAAPPPAAPPAASAGAAPVASSTPPSLEGTTHQSETKINLAPLVVAGSGVVLSILGALIYADGESMISDAESYCPDRKCPDNAPAGKLQEGQDGRTKANTGGAVLAVGLLTAAGGGVWYYLHPRKTVTPPIASLQPAFGAGFTGVTFEGRF